MSRAFPGLPIALVCLSASLAAAEVPDWESLRGVDTVRVVTADEDGASRETKVWLAVVDGAGFVRTGSTSWGENVARRPELVLKVAEASYPMRVEFVEDDEVRRRVTDAFREKYGFSDWMVSWMRGARPKIMRLLPKE